LGHFAARKQRGLAGKFGGKRNLRTVLDGFHSKERGEQIRSTGDSAMICQKESVIVRHKRLERRTQLRRSGRRILNEGNLTKTDDHVRQQRLVQRSSRYGKSGGGGRMGMANGIHVRAHPVKQEMHRDFRGKLAKTGELAAIEIRDDKILRGKRTLVYAGGSREDATIVEPHREVPLASDDVAALIHPSPRDADFAAMLFFTLRVAGKNSFRSHGGSLPGPEQ